ncbi:MAG: DNA translocase FtsK [Ruminococcus sp.]|nr:DNA translocase FtsK [Ruminococcus sp.]
MAEQKKNSSSKATAGQKKNQSQAQETEKKSSTGQKSGKAVEPKNEKNQFWSILLFAIGILIILMTLIEGTSGWNKIHNFLLGMFGAAVFFVPVILIYTSILIGMEKSQKCVTGRAVWGGALTLLTSSVIQIVFVGEIEGKSLPKQIAHLYSAGKELKGGGVLSMIIAGPLMAVFGETGAKIIAAIMFFVFIMLLTNMGILQFFEMLTKPFIWLGKCFIGVKNILTGGDFEDAFDDDDEADDLEAEMEAIELANSHSAEKTIKSSSNKKKTTQEPDFLFDIPLPTDKIQQTNSIKEEPPHKTETEKSENNSPDSKNENKSLDALINKAVDEKEKQLQKSERKSELVDTSEYADKPKPLYTMPSLSLLELADNKGNSADASAEMREKADVIVNTLSSFGVTVRISDIYRGPSITRYEIQPGAGVKVSKIKSLEDDIALYLAAQGVRIEAPVPGKSAVGIEVPNAKKDMVTLREILSSSEFRNNKSKLTFAVGKDIAGNIILGDVAKMPHVIIAGTTGSGKSVCTRSIIMSILYNATPDEVKLILIDPKIVEFKVFDGIPHLLIPIVTEAKKAAGALAWAVTEMMRRYNIFAEDGANDLKSYNAMAESNPDIEKMPQIVIFIDELADMMLVAGKEVEDSICRLAQMGRAAGMHLVVATQRPTTDVITGLIKANIPSRIALSVMSQIDSRTIIDMAGAEKLLGNGDMLYLPIGSSKPVRIQGCFASSKDVESTVNYVKSQSEFEFDNDIIQAVESCIPVSKSEKSTSDSEGAISVGSDEDYVEKAIAVAVENGQLSTSMLQRKLKLGYARAARIMDELEEIGVIGPSEGAKPRKVLMSRMQFEERRANKLN